MTAKEFEAIKSKVNNLKESISRDKGALDQIQTQFREFMKDPKATPEDGGKRLEELETKETKLKTKWEAATARLEKAADWSAL